MKTYLLFGLALLAAACAAAIPTLLGPTGGFELPTAHVASGVQVAVDHATDAFGVIYPDTRILAGVTPQLEIGAAYEKDQSFGIFAAPNVDSWDVNAKYALPLPMPSGQLAVGGRYFGVDIYHQWDLYLAGTMAVSEHVQATATLGYKQQFGGGRTYEGVIFGVAAEQTLNERISMGAEVFLGDKIGGATHGNLYATLAVTDALSARLAFANLGQDTQIALGASYAFGK